MGWTSNQNWKKKSDVVADIKGELQGYYSVLGFKSTSTGVWAVVSRPEGTPFIAVFLIQKECGSWGHKAIDESAHPYYYDCPISFLSLASPTNPAWRVKVAQYWAEKKGLVIE